MSGTDRNQIQDPEVPAVAPPNVQLPDDANPAADPAWEDGDADAYSFEDSERFEEDSLCSWMSEPESLANNWTGWAQKPGNVAVVGGTAGAGSASGLPASLSYAKIDSARNAAASALTEPVDATLDLVELCARAVARDIPFEVVEGFDPPVPPELQIRIAFWSFPENEADIRLYSCLANGNVEEFQKGDCLYRQNAVKDLLQIGFHLSATVETSVPPTLMSGSGSTSSVTAVMQNKLCASAVGASSSPYRFNVAVTLDRRHITSVSCSCGTSASWCAHVVAVSLYRINKPERACLRAPVSESLSRLQRDQLQKFAQYLINELPQTILPTAQKLLDELLSQRETQINQQPGAPDPTAGASIRDDASWCLDDSKLVDNIRRILTKFCKPSPTVLSDVNYLSSNAPPVAAEWQTVLQALMGRTPVGLWNLLSIVREMYRRHDANAGHLLDLITRECLGFDAVVVWWYNTKVNQTGTSICQVNYNKGVYGNSSGAQYSCAFLCDEIVNIWRLAALNPRQSPGQREALLSQLKSYHLKSIETIQKVINMHPGTNTQHASTDKGYLKMAPWLRWFDFNTFPGFKSAIEACLLTWDNYPIPGVTYAKTKALQTGSPGSGMIYVKTGGGTSVGDGHAGASASTLSPMSVGASSPSIPVIRDKRLTHRVGSTIGAGYPAGTPAGKGSGSGSRTAFGAHGDEPSSLHGRSDLPGPSGYGTGNPGAVTMRADSLTLDDSAINSSSDESGEGDLSAPSTNGNHSEEDTAQNFSVSPRVTSSKPPPIPPPKMPSMESGASEDNGDDVDNLERVYMFDKSASEEEPREGTSKFKSIPHMVMEAASELKPAEDEIEIKFARAEALRTHGYPAEALRIAVVLADDLLTQQPDLMVSLPDPIILPPAITPSKGGSGNASRKKRKTADLQTVIHPLTLAVGNLASSTLLKSAFIFTVLSEDPQYVDNAVNVALAGLELVRQPAPTKFLEVQMSQQEYHLVELLRKIPLSARHMDIIRDKARRLASGDYVRRQQPVFPFNLAVFVFEALANNAHRLPSDENHGFAAVVEALGAKLRVNEQEHPLLCEGMRRQRGELAQMLMVRYKEKPDRIAVILDRFLDRDVHTMYKSGGSNASYYARQLTAGLSVIEPFTGPAGTVLTLSAATTPIPRSNSSVSLTESEMRGLRIDEVRRNLSREQGSGFQIDQHNTSNASDSSLLDRQESHASVASRKSSFGSTVDQMDNSTGGLGSSSASSPAVSYNCKTLLAASPASDQTKAKRYQNSPAQPTEAQAHFLLELAKSLLTKAGGSHSTAIFTASGTAAAANSAVPTGTGAHRGLHLCAFQIGLYALGIHNRVSPNWLSRTYSSHVSWITGQAIEIGRVALRILMDTWEQHLTPTELATLADKASMSREPSIVAAAAELALCALPHGHALNPTEIQRALTQCADQSTGMMEKACVAIEAAARDQGVYPEVLFMVAKKWYTLYTDSIGSEAVGAAGSDHLGAGAVMPGADGNAVAAAAQQRGGLIPEDAAARFYAQHQPSASVGQFGPPSVVVAASSHQQRCTAAPVVMAPHPLYNQAAGQPPGVISHHLGPPAASAAAAAAQVAVASMHNPHSAANGVVAVHSQPSVALMAPATAPAAYHLPPHQHPLAAAVAQQQAAAAHAAAVQFAQPTVSLQAGSPQVHHIYHAAPGAVQTAAYGHHAAHPGSPAAGAPLFFRPAGHHPQQALYYPHSHAAAQNHHALLQMQQQLQQQQMAAAHAAHVTTPPPRLHLSHSASAPSLAPHHLLNHPPPSHHAQHDMQQGQSSYRYLLNAYRVGMLAMETMGRRIHDDNRNYVKYAQNPPYGDDVKWLFEIAKKLGIGHVQQYCLTATQSVVSPFVLYDLAVEAACLLARGTTPLAKAMLHPHVHPLLDRCVAMFHEASTQKLSHPRFTPADFEELLALVRAARTAFYQMVGGSERFQAFLQSLKRQKACKKDIWNQLLSALNSSN